MGYNGKMLSFIKKHWLVILLAAAAALLGFFWFSIRSQPQTTPPSVPQGVLERPGLPGEQINPGAQININVSPPQEQKTPLLLVSKTSPFTESETASFANKLGFSGQAFIAEDVSVGKTYNWSSRDEFLIVVPRENKIVYGQDLLLFPPPKTGVLPQPTSAENQLLAFARNLGLSIPSTTNQAGVRYLSLAGPEPLLVSQQTADALEVSLVPQFEGKDLTLGGADFTMVVGWFDKNGNLVRLDWENPIDSISAEEEYQLKNLTEIRETVLQKGRVVVLEDGLPIARAGNSLRTATINQVKIVYLVPSQGSLSHPVYVLFGQGRLSDGRSVEVEIFLPAIKEEFFRN